MSDRPPGRRTQHAQQSICMQQKRVVRINAWQNDAPMICPRNINYLGHQSTTGHIRSLILSLGMGRQSIVF